MAGSSLFTLLSGCKTIDVNQVAYLVKSGQTLTHSFEDFSPEQEYYIGRTVGALILDRYRVYDHAEVNFYLNILGQSLAQSSDLPETFAGYHFLALDSMEINGLAAPGGFIFITRGLMRCCRTEDSLAAVLAHEIAHVQAKHGLQAIQQSRLTDLFTNIGLESARQFGGEKLARITENFGATITDISKTLITSGYSQSQEYEADAAAVTLLNRVGYDPHSMIDMLDQMGQRLEPGKLDFGKTHPNSSDRIEELRQGIRALPEETPSENRQKRYHRLTGLI